MLLLAPFGRSAAINRLISIIDIHNASPLNRLLYRFLSALLKLIYYSLVCMQEKLGKWRDIFLFV